VSSRARLAAAVIAASFAAAAPAGAARPSQPGQQGYPHRPVCGPPAAGHARCHSDVVTEQDGTTPLATAGPAGYGPDQLRSAYNLPSTTGGAGQTIAIVDAYDLPTAESDLNTYRAQFGIPSCTSASGCFRKMGQTGGAVPAVNASWGQEIALDLDMASAICPNCNILLVEASSASVADLATAVDTAVSRGATVVSNSYGANEFSSETSFDGHYNHPGVAITVSSGDNGYGVQYPASSRYVTAVGGTSLKTASTTRGWTETAWSGGGSGCSALETQPSWQAGLGSCAKRTVADVSAVADPNTGVAVYDSTPYSGSSGWLVFGGTSVAAPVIAGVYALAGNASTAGSSYPYSHRSSLNDVTSGSNGRCKRTAYLCTAGPGYDGPTGLGTPNGVGAF